jgi:small conductance mechanosensitive channel
MERPSLYTEVMNNEIHQGVNNMKFKFKSKKQMIQTIVVGSVILICILLAVLSPIIFAGTDFANFIANTLGEFFDFVTFLTNNYVTILKSVTIIFFMWIISKVLRFLIVIVTNISKKSITIGIIVNSIIKYATVIIAVFLILSAWGVETPTLLAGAGILGLALSFGAQSLIEDVISGLFIIFEKDFQVGDIVEVDGFRGSVIAIGIRTTKIEDIAGDVKIINNSEIRGAVNTSNNLHPAICDLSVSYDTNLEALEVLIRDELPNIKKAIPDIVEGPFYKGVQNLAESAVVIRIIARVEENKKYQVVRDLNREMKLFCDKNKINIPFNQLVVTMHSDMPKSE